MEKDDRLPIDLESLFERTLLHEMLHTKVGGATVDVKGKINTGDNSGFRYASSLAFSAWKDAEANAYLGLIGWLLHKGFALLNNRLVSIEPQTKTGNTAPQTRS